MTSVRARWGVPLVLVADASMTAVARPGRVRHRSGRPLAWSRARVYGRTVAADPPSDEDRRQAIRIALSGLGSGHDLGAIGRLIEPLHPRHDTFPAEVFLELAAGAIEIAGASRHHPIEMGELAKRFLPDRRSVSKVHRSKLDFSLRAGAMIRAGVQPDLLEDAAWWRADDLWVWALEALHVYVQVAAERAGLTPAEICSQLAARSEVTLDSTG